MKVETESRREYINDLSLKIEAAVEAAISDFDFTRDGKWGVLAAAKYIARSLAKHAQYRKEDVMEGVELVLKSVAMESLIECDKRGERK